MGCAPSKLDNEDTVRRCKERRRLMKAAVFARHHLSAAHADYCRSLRTTGSALVTFASGEPFSISDHTPAVLLRSAAAAKPPIFTPPPRHTTPSPPPMSATSSHSHNPPPPPPPRRKKPIKLPHILSDSSFSSSPPPNPNFFTYNSTANSNYSSTPSQASSVWNWDSFYPPPSPPGSEFFQNLEKTKKNGTRIENNDYDDDHRYIDNESYDKASNFTSYSNPFGRNDETKQYDDRGSSFSSYSRCSDNNHVKAHMKQPPLQKTGPNSRNWESEEDEAEREEVQCSEWGDHDHDCNSSSSSGDDDDDHEDVGSLRSGSGIGTRSNFGSVRNDSSNVRMNVKKFSSISEKLSSEDDDGKSSISWGNGNNERMNSDSRIAVRHKDLAEIVEALREYFDKAASAGEQVTEMLEADRAQLNRSFKQLRKTIYHSSGLLSNLSSSWTSKPPLAVKYRFEPSSIEQSGDSKSLCSTLERLLAWEKKLYQEVKAREVVKIEHERKLSTLQSQEYRGEDEAKLDKTKASIKRLQSLILVTSQAVSTTSFAIVGLRDVDLVPQLVELCHSFMYMWRSMHQQHRLQNDIVQQVRGLVNHIKKGQSSTSDLHRQSTIDLKSAVSSWHSNFNRLIKFQRDFIRSLHAWFKLTLLPVTTDSNRQVNNNNNKNEVFSFFDEWKLALDRVPDTVASEAINSFNNVVHSISVKQTEELKIKKRTESASKELEKRASSLRNLEKKYYSSYSMVGVGPENGEVLDTRDPLADKRSELVLCQRRVEDETVKYSKAVEVTRAMTLNNIQTGLPGVFQAMTSFSALITEALETVCTRSYAIQ